MTAAVAMVVSAVNCDVFLRLTKDLGERPVPDLKNASPSSGNRSSKSVHFADTKGLALTSTSFFDKENLSPTESRKKMFTYLKDNKQREAGLPAKLLNFKSAVSYEDVLARLGRQNVCLEKIVCNSFGIYGRIQVWNLAFEKEVCVRYTFDAWQTFLDHYANHIPGSSSAKTDTFFFHLRPPQTTAARKMEFAICYKVCDEEFWDNNHGDNYRLVYFEPE